MELHALSLDDQYNKLIDGLYQNGYCVLDDFITTDTCAGILSELQKEQTEGSFHKAGVGKDAEHKIVHTIRGDYIKWLETDEAHPHTNLYLAKLQELRQVLNRQCFLGLQDIEVHMTQYPAHSGYHRHVDAFHKDDNRCISVVLYLNFDWLESYNGRLILYPDVTPAAPIEIYPKAGRLALFESTLEHEVIPATQKRYSITGWMLREKRFF